MNEKETAYHEAGHVVAHIRLGVMQDFATIKRGDWTLGAVSAEGKEHVWDADDADKQVLCYCAGYAALKAAGYDDTAADAGAWDDFENADELITFWSLPGDLVEWKNRSIELMSSAERQCPVPAQDTVPRKLAPRVLWAWDHARHL